MTKIIIGIVLAAVVIGGGILLTRDSAEAPETSDATSQTGQPTDETVDEQPEAEQEAAATITYTDRGFSVDNSTVAAGSVIRIVNNSGSVLDFASNEHPVHSDNSEFNIGTISSGETDTFTVSRTGVWGFHNHENDGHTGEIAVK